jgi:hypothetical protein
MSVFIVVAKKSGYNTYKKRTERGYPSRHNMNLNEEETWNA